MSARTWKNLLADQMPEGWAHEIDQFEAQMELKKLGKLEDKIFAETRLRRGAYGQRYDNGQRHDGVDTRQLAFPGDHTKGPETVWDAPGMHRIKIPYGGMSNEQMNVLADLADDYSDGILHITTRQDIQLHFVHIEDTPDLMRRLAAVGITTREACGNSVRNITGCPLAGVCRDEAFDISPYAKALMHFFLGHPDVQDFGRKFKPAFSGCAQHACGLTNMHDLGLIAKIKDVDGKPTRGFAMYIGGGLGAVPHEAKLLFDFVTEEELLPVSQCVARVYTRLGEKRNRNRARIKFLVAKLGIDEYRRLVEEERKVVPHDDRWTAYLKELPHYEDSPLKDAVQLSAGAKPDGFEDWVRTNVYKQRQSGYVVVTINLPLGDATSDQFRKLADVAAEYVGDSVRTTVEQNLVLRWVSEADLPSLYLRLKDIHLATPGAGTIVDITACPGTDTCKLGIAASRGVAGELRSHLTAKRDTLPDSVKGLKIKASGCFNSCGQHHLSDLGFYGNSRKVGNYAVPHFQVVLGGQWEENGGAYGMMMGAVPSKRIPELVDSLTDTFVQQREGDESFRQWIARLGKKEVRELLKPFMTVPSYGEDPSFYTDWGDAREFTLGDMGVGECAGEVVSMFSMEISKAESEAFDAQVAFDDEDYAGADALAYKGMVLAAQALVRTQFWDISNDADQIVDEFRKRFFDTELFYDRYAKGKFAQYLFDRHERDDVEVERDTARSTIEETNLFIEATHACEARLTASTAEVLK